MEKKQEILIMQLITTHKKRLKKARELVSKYEFELSGLNEMLDSVKIEIEELTPKIEE